MTSDLSVKGGTTIRKLKDDEIVEFIGPPQKEPSAGLSRVHCRALLDGKTGWLTIKGNHGTAFLEQVRRPYYCVIAETPLYAGFEPTSSQTRAAAPAELFGVIEGPRKEQATEVQRVQCTAKLDDAAGWVTLKDTDGADNFECKEVLTVARPTAITGQFDIGSGKALRRLDVGETLEALEEEKSDETRKLTRVRVKALSDGKEGWITLRGNQGTAYAEPKSVYVAKKNLSLEAGRNFGGACVRQLEAGEVVSYKGEPVLVEVEGDTRVKGLSLSDGSEGWLTVSPDSLSEWSSHYTCAADEASLFDRIEPAAAVALRRIEKDEALEAIAVPVVCESLVRLRVRAMKDGKVGFVTIRDATGAGCFEPKV